jgi:hypothetical protein
VRVVRIRWMLRWAWASASPRVGPQRLASSTALRLDHSPSTGSRSGAYPGSRSAWHGVGFLLAGGDVPAVPSAATTATAGAGLTSRGAPMPPWDLSARWDSLRR